MNYLLFLDLSELLFRANIVLPWYSEADKSHKLQLVLGQDENPQGQCQ